MEDRIDTIWRDQDLVVANAVTLDEVALRPPRADEYAGRAANGQRNERAKEDAVADAHEIGMTLEGQIVHRDDDGSAYQRRSDVLDMDEARSDRAQQPREADRHPQDLRLAPDHQRFDARRAATGLAHERGETERRLETDQLSQEVRDVGLVARAVSTERVGIDDDEGRRHASAPRYTSMVPRAARCHEKPRARSRPACARSSRRTWASRRPAAIDAVSSGSTKTT